MMKTRTALFACVAVIGLIAFPEPLPDGKRYNETVGDYTWWFDVENGEAIIRNVFDDDWAGRAVFPEPLGAVAIPDVLGERRVTGVGLGAFDNCYSLTSVTIPESVTFIGADAFFHCDGLVSAPIPSGVTSIGESAFYGCSKLKSATAETIPSGVTNIGDRAFWGCAGLASVTIPSGMRNIGEDVFVGCTGLTSVTISPSVTNIGAGAFFNCSGVTSVKIPESVTSIGNGAFCECSGLTSMIIPSNVRSIGDEAFWWCNGLLSVSILSDVRSIGRMTFARCSSLTSVLIPSNVTSIGERAFAGCSGLTSVIIPPSVTNIGDAAFEECNSIAMLALPPKVTNIGRSTFERCCALTSVDIPSGVTNIGDQAFRDCFRLTSVTIPASVVSIGEEAFERCSEVSLVTMPGHFVWTDVFDLNSTITSLTIADGETNIIDGAFYGCCGLESVTIPRGVKRIGSMAFCGCDALTLLDIPVGVESIGYSSFEECSGLMSVTIPYSVTNIGDRAFFWCSEMNPVVIPQGVTSVGGQSFGHCHALTEVTIPSSLKSIGLGAFDDCPSLTVIHVSNNGEIDAVKQMLSDSWFDVGSVTFDYVGDPVVPPYEPPAEPVATNTITYVSLEGAVNTNLTQFTTNDLPLVLGPVEREGYTFLGWTPNGGVIPVGTVTNVTFTANWEEIVEPPPEDPPVEPTITHTVTFDLGEHGTRTGGGELEQEVADGETAVAPEVQAEDGWVFLYWDCDFSSVGGDLTVTAVYEQVVVEDGVYVVSKDGYDWTVTVEWGEVWIGDRTAWSYSEPAISPQPQGALEIPEEFFGLPVVGLCTCAFMYCTEMTSARIPKDMWSVSSWAFMGCSALTTISVDEENECLMYEDGFLLGVDWDGRTSLKLAVGKTGACAVPNGVATVDSNAFSLCPEMTELALPESVTDFEADAVNDCAALQSITVAEGNPNFRSTNGFLLSKDGTSLVVCPGGIEDVAVPEGVRVVGSFYEPTQELFSPFASGTKMRSIAIPASVEQIADGAFSACEFLTGITIDAANAAYKAVNGLLLSSDGTSMLSCAGGVRDASVPEGGRSVADSAFSESVSLLSATLPASVTHIGMGAFSYCWLLTSVYFEGNAPEVDEGDPEWWAMGLYDGADYVTTYVREGTSGWGDVPGTWQGRPINFWRQDDPPPEPPVEPVVTNTITYLGLDGAANPNPATFTVRDLPLVLKPLTREGYTFLGWTPWNGVIPAGTVTNVTFTALWEEIVIPPPEPPANPDAPSVIVDPAPKAEDVVPVNAEDVTSALAYNGYLAKGDEVVGSVTVKVAKKGKVTATVQLPEGSGSKALKKFSYAGTLGADGSAALACKKNNGEMSVAVGAKALSGTVKQGGETYVINGRLGTKDVLASVDSLLDKNVWTVALHTPTNGVPHPLVNGYSVLTVSGAKKGKVKVAGFMADGTKVSVTAQGTVFDSCVIVPVNAALYKGKAGGFSLKLKIEGENKIEVGNVSDWTAVVDGKTVSVKWDAASASAKSDVGSGAAFRMDAADIPFDDVVVASADGTMSTLPSGVEVDSVGGKWSLPKAGKVAFTKDKSDLDTSKFGENPAGLKLSYAAKTGAFKGTFSLYRQTVPGKLKKEKATVNGVVVKGVGYGSAVIKNIGAMPVTVGADCGECRP